MTIDHDEIEHFLPDMHFHLARCDLSAQCRIRTEKQLLARLPTGIKGATYLCTPKGTVRQQTPIFTGKGDSLGHALVNNIYTVLSKTMNIGLTGTEISALDCVIEKTVHTVPIVLVILGTVDSTLSGDGVSTAGGILVTKTIHIVSKLTQGGCSRTSSQSRTDHNDLEFSLVGRVDQLGRKAVVFPLFRKRTVRNF